MKTYNQRRTDGLEKYPSTSVNILLIKAQLIGGIRQGFHFQLLSQLAIRYLAIPTKSVPCERVVTVLVIKSSKKDHVYCLIMFAN